jgi:hypothetical protein
MASGARVNLSLKHGDAEQVRALDLLIDSNQRGGTPVEWLAGVSVMANLAPAELGATSVALVATETLLDGAIQANAVLYRFEVAVSPWIEDRAWIVISNDYLRAMLAARGDVPALGEAPESCPWMAGFFTPEARLLSVNAQHTIAAMARLVGAAAVNCCIANCKPPSPTGLQGDSYRGIGPADAS